MLNFFFQSSKIINQYILLIILVGILNVSVFSGELVYLSFLGMVIAFLVSILIYGRIVETLGAREKQSSRKIIKDNWVNYFIVSILLAIPVYIIIILIKLVPISGEQFLIIKEGLKATIWVVSLYVIPIVFIKNKGFIAIVAGITYLFANIRKSIQVIPFIILIFAINAGGILWLLNQTQVKQDLLQAIPIMMLVNIVSTYLSFIVFTSASNILVRSIKIEDE